MLLYIWQCILKLDSVFFFFTELTAIQQAITTPKTTLTEFFSLCNRQDIVGQFAKTIMYTDIPKFFTWNKQSKSWELSCPGAGILRLEYLNSYCRQKLKTFSLKVEHKSFKLNISLGKIFPQHFPVRTSRELIFYRENYFLHSERVRENSMIKIKSAGKNVMHEEETRMLISPILFLVLWLQAMTFGP